MLGFLKRLFGKKKAEPRFSDEEYDRHYEAKKAALEKQLGPMYDMVGHAIIPFQIGGGVDMYYFPSAIPGTAFATMELIEPDGSGPQPNRIGTYELVAFTRHQILLRDGGSDEPKRFNKIERRMCGIFTAIGNYSYKAVLNPGDTCEIPSGKDGENRCMVLDQWRRDELEFEIDGNRHCLLLVIEVFRSEMEFAMANGSPALFERLKANGYYPYSDLDRDPVA